ncbi:hypothetical protein PMAYCL1PPCAC_20579, partial [Pristionchus mayeri]
AGSVPRPSFFDKVSRQAREEYVDNMFDVVKSRQQILDDELEWGRENGIEAEVRDHQKARLAYYDGHTERITEAFKELPEAFMKMYSYHRDFSLHTERAKALHRLLNASTPELRSLLQASCPWNIYKFANTDMFPEYKR